MLNPHKYFQEIRERSLVARQTDQPAASAAIRDFYRLIELPAPYIVFVDGPLQLHLVPPVLAGILASDRWVHLVEQLGMQPLADDVWYQHWHELWIAEGEPLLQWHLSSSDTVYARRSAKLLECEEQAPLSTLAMEKNQLSAISLAVARKLQFILKDKLAQTSPEDCRKLAGPLGGYGYLPFLVNHDLMREMKTFSEKVWQSLSSERAMKIAQHRLTVADLMEAANELMRFHGGLWFLVDARMRKLFYQDDSLKAPSPFRRMLVVGWSWISSSSAYKPIAEPFPHYISYSSFLDVLLFFNDSYLRFYSAEELDRLTVFQRLSESVFACCLDYNLAFVCKWPRLLEMDQTCSNPYETLTLQFGDGLSIHA